MLAHVAGVSRQVMRAGVTKAPVLRAFSAPMSTGVVSERIPATLESSEGKTIYYADNDKSQVILTEDEHGVEYDSEGKKLFRPIKGLKRFMTSNGLTGPQFMVPIGLWVGIPILALEGFRLTEETQLAGSFMIFCGALYTQFGDGIAKYLDEYADNILAEQQAKDDTYIAEAEVAMSKMAEGLSVVDDTKGVSALETLAATQAAELAMRQEKSAMRAAMVRILDTISAQEDTERRQTQSQLVADALDQVVAKIESDKKLKKTALDQALQSLAEPGKGAGADVVSGLFVSHFKDVAAKATAAAGGKVPSSAKPVSEKEVESLMAELCFGNNADEMAAKKKAWGFQG
ncbi:unnamed protein product [Chrysoparadoxa australica]